MKEDANARNVACRVGKQPEDSSEVGLRIRDADEDQCASPIKDGKILAELRLDRPRKPESFATFCL